VSAFAEFVDLRAPRLDVTLPELIWLAKIEKATDAQDVHVDHLTWCEKRLWQKGLLRRFEWGSRRGAWKFAEYEISDIGRMTLKFHRERWTRLSRR
jgi:hypothetical protein